jgi:hypothetical protein
VKLRRAQRVFPQSARVIGEWALAHRLLVDVGYCLFLCLYGLLVKIASSSSDLPHGI